MNPSEELIHKKTRKPHGYWTKENCLQEARKYPSRQEFLKGCSAAYQTAQKNKWLGEVFPDKRISYQKLIDRFLPHKKGQVPDNYWISEFKIAGILLEEKPEELWLKVIAPGSKINSLNWFRTDWGRRYVKEQEIKIKTIESQRKLSEAISESKKETESKVEIPVEDFRIVERPKSVLDFINYG